ncbi:uncharacterized protein LOC106777554 isoform X1 [Vigna radiata var. radiata]|uniref:Uncharacterized protein LOC106777554 isoform X1 n=1 Tax=Vigna radiata var. radiata TaxID=3916 RepID=A0A1S3VQI7_VIGRR|nr:uncharacterized protein LOC106777554 isoform X1 [Vigna radiata var. radiata]XP_014520649.1 uncharacterized protein LOC106777554 isoform X1 [Vigna radiata var. radiata]XP_014520650.1 uncharacterized protein LOC106777554 isoform X1 [Vigna radiata var. radiata]XP_014520651.1 uncharacterized protein LOC106777554 isoform X1 [Vigna radiata var. radiata]
MSRRHSDSKRRHSRFDPQPSPKRYRRDAYGKEEKERVANGANVRNGDHRRLNQDEPPSAKQRCASLHSKPNDQQAPHPTQHEKRGSTGQVGQSSGQSKAGERGWWKDARKQLNERAETSHRREQRDGKSQAKLDNNTFQRRDDFSERKDDPLPTSRKRPAFREKRIPVESGDPNLVAAVAINSSEIDHPAGRNDRKKEERSNNPHHLGRPEKPFADDRAPNKVGARRDGFPSRGRRYGGNDSYRGRDKFNGRQDKIQTEKWKHDLYQEVSKDPIPQNEDDQIAKLEALLAS